MVRERSIIQRFQTLEKEVEPKPQIVKNCIRAFLVGGLIGAITSICMVFLGALLTGVGIYDKIATYAGAGTVVPITGFSNAIVAPAIEFKKEGFVFGVAAKMFTIAGPVLVYGIGSSVIVGIVYYIFTKL